MRMLLFYSLGTWVASAWRTAPVTPLGGSATCWCLTDAAISDQSVLSYFSSRGLIITAVFVLINNGKGHTLS